MFTIERILRKVIMQTYSVDSEKYYRPNLNEFKLKCSFDYISKTDKIIHYAVLQF